MQRWRQIEEDRICSAFHEAGHAVLALACGAKWVNPWIAPIEQVDLTTKRAFSGRCQRSVIRGKINLAMVGYAGPLAEDVSRAYRRGQDVHGTFADFNTIDYDLQWTGSDTDRAHTDDLVHERSRVRAFKQCGMILKEHWRAVSGIAFHVHSLHKKEFKRCDLKKKRWDGLLEPVDLPPRD
jgi:hypothetical protein